MSEPKALPTVTIEHRGFTHECRLVIANEQGGARDATTADLAAILAALPDAARSELLRPLLDAEDMAQAVRIAALEAELKGEREAHAETRQLFGGALLRLQALGENTFDLDRGKP